MCRIPYDHLPTRVAERQGVHSHHTGFPVLNPTGGGTDAGRATWLPRSDSLIPLEAQKVRSFPQALLTWSLSEGLSSPLWLMAKLLGCRFRTGILRGGYLMQTKASDWGPNATPDLRGLDESFSEANSFLPATNLQFVTTTALRPENCCWELSFILGLHFSLQSVSPWKSLPPPKVFLTAPSLPSVYEVAARSVNWHPFSSAPALANAILLWSKCWGKEQFLLPDTRGSGLGSPWTCFLLDFYSKIIFLLVFKKAFLSQWLTALSERHFSKE